MPSYHLEVVLSITTMTENITFPQLRWRAINMTYLTGENNNTLNVFYLKFYKQI